MSSLVDSGSATDEPVSYRQVDPSAHMRLSVHVSSETALSYTLYPAEDRITVDIGDDPAQVVMFLDRMGICQMFLLLQETLRELSPAAEQLRDHRRDHSRDPDVILGKVRELVCEVIAPLVYPGTPKPDYRRLAVDLSERLLHLDYWMCHGGSTPSPWDHRRQPAGK